MDTYFGDNLEDELATLVALLRPLFAAETERQRERMPVVVALRALGPHLTYRDIGLLPEFGVTRERVRQVEARALRLLRHPSRRSQVLAVAIHYPRLYRAVFGEPLAVANDYWIDAGRPATESEAVDWVKHLAHRDFFA